MADPNCSVVDGLEREWRDALCRRDMERLQSLVHKDFVLIGTRSSGPFMMTRDEWLDAIQRREVDAIDVEVQDATTVGDVMIGTVQARWRLKYLGRVIEDEDRTGKALRRVVHMRHENFTAAVDLGIELGLVRVDRTTSADLHHLTN